MSSISSPTQLEVCQDVDGFFGNLSSAFDITAQVINLVYLIPPLDERYVSFDRTINELRNRRSNDPLTQSLIILEGQQWYEDLKNFRRCTIHRKIIQCKFVTEFSMMQTTWPTVTTILLPDNPFENDPTYLENLTMEVFGVNIFQNVLAAIDNLYAMMEAVISVAGHIPI